VYVLVSDRLFYFLRLHSFLNAAEALLGGEICFAARLQLVIGTSRSPNVVSFLLNELPFKGTTRINNPLIGFGMATLSRYYETVNTNSYYNRTSLLP